MKSSRSLLLGLVLAAVLAGLGYSTQRSAQRRVEAALDACIAAYVGQNERGAFAVSCDPRDYEAVSLGAADPKLLDVALDKALDHQRREGQAGLWYAAAVAFALIFAVPYLWYFLLRRIGELRDAITGGGARP